MVRLQVLRSVRRLQVTARSTYLKCSAAISYHRRGEEEREASVNESGAEMLSWMCLELQTNPLLLFLPDLIVIVLCRSVGVPLIIRHLRNSLKLMQAVCLQPRFHKLLVLINHPVIAIWSLPGKMDSTLNYLITRRKTVENMKNRHRHKQGIKSYVRFEVFTVVIMKSAIFWDIKSQFIPHR
jgi:hypothetical protein